MKIYIQENKYINKWKGKNLFFFYLYLRRDISKEFLLNESRIFFEVIQE
jgi:hypothetical protein